MARTKIKEEDTLRYRIETRVTSKKFQELQRILDQNPHKDAVVARCGSLEGLIGGLQQKNIQCHFERNDRSCPIH